MKIAEKYKQTEVGLIPSDWDTLLLAELATKIGSGITPTGGSTVYKEDGRPFIRSQNIGWGNLLLYDIAYIDDETHQTFPNTEIKLNDVFINISGASIGRSSFANEKLVGGNVNQHVCIIRVIDKKLNPKYLNLFLLSKNGQKQIDSFQSGGNRQGLNIGQIKTFQIPIPPTIEEQTAIATALSDADALINSLEKLIAKKRNIKQGAMQKLLNPMVNGELLMVNEGDNCQLSIKNYQLKKGWEVKKLGDVGEIRMCKRIFSNQTKEHGDIPFFKIGTFGSEPDSYISIELYIEFKQKFSFPKKGDILISAAGTIGRTVVYNGEPSYFQDSNIVWIDNNEGLISNQFLYYILQIVNFNTEGGTIQRLYNSILRNAEFYCPTKAEQTRIATILSDMDAEIQVLETKLEKYLKVKLGMMQNLLTGKIRLI